MQLTAFDPAKKAGPVTQGLRIMKMSALLLLIVLQVAGRPAASAQVTLKETGAPLEKVLKAIKKQSAYDLFFDENLVKLKGRPVVIDVNNIPVEEALKLVFKNQDHLTYSLNGKIISIKERIEKKSDPVTEGLNPRLEIPPTIDVTIVVTGVDGVALEGASVVIKGQSKGVATDVNGRAVLKGLNGNETVVISFTGYRSQEVKIDNKTALGIRLEAKEESLQEVVVNKGYYTEKQRFSVGNTVSVKAADIEKQPVQNPLLALQGRVPGLEITQLTGVNGGGVQVRIQGRNSISQGNDPLIIVDGVQFPLQFAQGPNYLEGIVQGGSPLNYINPNDIESIDILKDADATAIYGSRAASGAILITTKKGKTGRTKMDVNVQQGWSKVARKLDMLNSRQYLDMRYEALKNDKIALSSLNQTGNYDLTVWDTTGRYTDWQKELIGGNALYTNINASVSGGELSTQYFISGTYKRQTTVFPGEFDDKTGGLHFNISANSKDQRFKIQLSGNFMYDNNQLPGIDLTQSAVLMAPNAPGLYKEDGTLNWEQNVAGTSTFFNPLAKVMGSDFNSTTKSVVNNLNINYRILPGLEVRSNIGYSSVQSSINTVYRLEIERPERRSTAQRFTSSAERDMNSWIFEPQLQYSGKFRKGKIEALLGGSVLQGRSKVLNIIASGFANDLLMQTMSAATSFQGASAATESKFNGLFGRFNYVWNNKYILNLTARRDGSSKFGDANKLHDFGSAGFAWIFGQEEWINNNLKFLSLGKLRGSYGTTGNDQIGDFGNLSVYNILSSPGILYQGGGIALSPSRIPNPHIQWEETRKLQAGIDLGFSNDRILFSATFVRNRSSNQLISYTVPSTTGFVSIRQNLPALVQNTSLEFSLNAIAVKAKDLYWSISANLTIPDNKLISFPGIEKTIYADPNNGMVIGNRLGTTPVYRYAGVDPTTGRYLLYDKNGNITSSPDLINDKTLSISNFAKYYGGVQSSLSYKGVQLDVTFQFVRQLGINSLYFYNAFTSSLVPGSFNTSGLTNQLTTILNRWQKPGDQTDIAKYSTISGNAGVSLYAPSSDAGYNYDASFIRLKNLSLSWRLPTHWLQLMKLQNARVYCQAQNLATITNYRGLDPETGNTTALPPLRVLTAGIQITF
ncbi:MAG: SusC/RagA family TonB-linked outer membrane protein [Sediminibacterium sp.]